MKVALVSDLHLEFSDYDFNFNQLDVDIIVFAGDILPIARKNVVSWLKERVNHIPTIFVPGNHDYYGGVIAEAEESWKKEAKDSHIHVLIEDKFIMGKYIFLGTPMFSNLSLPSKWPKPVLEAMLPQSIADFSSIKATHDRRWQVIDMLSRSNKCLKWLDNELPNINEMEKDDNKYIVITHWAPSSKSISEQFLGNELNSYFALDNNHMVERSHLWLHGHTHNRCDYYLNNDHTKGHVVNNPRGYVNKMGDQEIPGKYFPKVIEV